MLDIDGFSPHARDLLKNFKRESTPGREAVERFFWPIFTELMGIQVQLCQVRARLARSLPPEIMGLFWSSRCLNDRIDLPDQIGSFFSQKIFFKKIHKKIKKKSTKKIKKKKNLNFGF